MLDLCQKKYQHKLVFFIHTAQGKALKLASNSEVNSKILFLKTYFDLRRRAINPIKPKPAISIA